MEDDAAQRRRFKEDSWLIARCYLGFSAAIVVTIPCVLISSTLYNHVWLGDYEDLFFMITFFGPFLLVLIGAVALIRRQHWGFELIAVIGGVGMVFVGMVFLWALSGTLGGEGILFRGPPLEERLGLQYSLPNSLLQEGLRATGRYPLSQYTPDYLNGRRPFPETVTATYVPADVPSTSRHIVSVNPIDDEYWGAATIIEHRCELVAYHQVPVTTRDGTHEWTLRQHRWRLPKGAACLGSAAIWVEEYDNTSSP